MQLRGILILFLLALTSGTYLFSQVKEFSANELEKRMAKINDSMYAAIYEVTNAEYATFLKELKASSPKLYEECKVDASGWAKSVSEDSLTRSYHSNIAFSKYPVVNISYKGAVEFCRWLTKHYNNEEKRKFAQVNFTLPTKMEMIEAALGGTDKMYPWGNYYMVNKKGFYMCNFKPVSDYYLVWDSLGNPYIQEYDGLNTIHSAEFPEDKIFYTMEVNSFYPNMFGIYNTSGNVAEMLITENFAIGGSWNSYGGEIWPRSIKKYHYPSSEVGFRVFMKIIQKVNNQ